MVEHQYSYTYQWDIPTCVYSHGVSSLKKSMKYVLEEERNRLFFFSYRSDNIIKKRDEQVVGSSFEFITREINGKYSMLWHLTYLVEFCTRVFVIENTFVWWNSFLEGGFGFLLVYSVTSYVLTTKNQVFWIPTNDGSPSRQYYLARRKNNGTSL